MIEERPSDTALRLALLLPLGRQGKAAALANRLRTIGFRYPVNLS